MYDHAISRTAIFILALVMIAFGIYHFIYPKNLMVFVPAFIPGGLFWVYIVGLAFILAAVAFIANKKAKLAAYLLAALLFVFVLLIHLPAFANAGDIEMRHMAFINILKDTALAAFALHIGANVKSLR